MIMNCVADPTSKHQTKRHAYMMLGSNCSLYTLRRVCVYVCVYINVCHYDRKQKVEINQSLKEGDIYSTQYSSIP